MRFIYRRKFTERLWAYEGEIYVADVIRYRRHGLRRAQLNRIRPYAINFLIDSTNQLFNSRRVSW